MTNGLNPIPPPPGPANVPKPSGSAANLKVLAWGGFKSALTYTFDDSEPSQVDHWPDLKATGIPVTFYITTSNKAYKGYDAAWKEALSRGNELGNHTVNHCGFKFENCDNDHLATPEAEVDQCTDYLKSTYGVSNVWTMAYPFGDTGYEPDAQSRFFMARGISDGLQMPGGLQVPGDYMDPFDLVIKGLQGDESAAALNGFIDDAHNKGGWLVFLFHTILPDDDIRYAGVDVKNIVASVTHTKSLSDVWIDTVASVGAYWVGQTAFQATPPTTANGTSTWTWKLPAHFPPKRALRVTVGGGTLKQGGTELVWDPHGYYEVMLDAGSLTWSP
jgi:peptidoglycan/xylan/chitin deacetylase (PgdA/CDA1 family)